MTFFLSIFLYIYLAFLFFWLVFCWVAIYHMLRFGFKNFTTFFTTFIFIGISIIMLAVSYNYIIEIDWDANITILGGILNPQMPFN